MWEKVVEETFPMFTPEAQKEWLNQIIQGEEINGKKLASLIDTCYVTMKIILDRNAEDLPEDGVALMNEVIADADGTKYVANTDPEELVDFVLKLKASYYDREWAKRITEIMLHMMKPAERKERLGCLIHGGRVDSDKLAELMNDCAAKAAEKYSSLGGEEEITTALQNIDGKEYVTHAGTPNMVTWIIKLQNEDLWTERIVELVFEFLLTEEEKQIEDPAELIDYCRDKAIGVCEGHLDEEIVEELRGIDGKTFVEETDPWMLKNWMKSLV